MVKCLLLGSLLRMDSETGIHYKMPRILFIIQPTIRCQVNSEKRVMFLHRSCAAPKPQLFRELSISVNIGHIFVTPN